MDWRDLKIALALGRHESLGGAARALGMDATTVSRRVSALEDALGVTLFVRERGAWRPTSSGRVVLERCARMAAEVRVLEHDVGDATEQARGKVRLTTLGAVASRWLVPHMRELREEHPELRLELFTTPEDIDLIGGRADIGLRMREPTRAGLVARRLAHLRMSVVATPEIARMPPHERPVVLVGFESMEIPENSAAMRHGGVIAGSSTSVALAAQMIEEGVGLGMLMEEDADTRVARGELVELERGAAQRGIWRVAPEEIARSARIRAVGAWLDRIFEEHRSRKK